MRFYAVDECDLEIIITLGGASAIPRTQITKQRWVASKSVYKSGKIRVSCLTLW